VCIVKYYSLRWFVTENGRAVDYWNRVHDAAIFHYSSEMQSIMITVGVCDKVSVFGFGKAVDDLPAIDLTLHSLGALHPTVGLHPADTTLEQPDSGGCARGLGRRSREAVKWMSGELVSAAAMPTATGILKYSFHDCALLGSSSPLTVMDLVAGKGKKRSQYRGNLVYPGR
jgi:hypothetical protein